jgi:flavin reductase (DIM6/NTAB) family NADH-FMN oxidoreductase RutF
MTAALGRIPSGLFIVTVQYRETATGVLTSWVQQCSFNPPQTTVAVNKERDILSYLVVGATLTLNILGEENKELVSHFGKGVAPGQDAFAGLSVRREDSFAPVLSDCLGYLDCRVVSQLEAGDHVLLVAEVVQGDLFTQGRPAVHIRKRGSHY